VRLLAVGLVPLALLAARLKADTYWGGPPSCGEPVIRVQHLPEEHFGEADLSRCEIVLNSGYRWPWPAVCTIVIHEAGHLHGLTHESPRWVMSARYRGALRTCHETAWFPLSGSDWPEDYTP
jgi:hypothetical protein